MVITSNALRGKILTVELFRIECAESSFRSKFLFPVTDSYVFLREDEATAPNCKSKKVK